MFTSPPVAAPVERRRFTNGQERVVVVGRRLGEAVVEAPRGQELEESKGRVRFGNAEEALGAPGEAAFQRRRERLV